MRRWLWPALGGLATGIVVTLIGIYQPDEMEHLRWPGALAAFILGPLAASAVGLGDTHSQAEMIVYYAIFFVASIGFWGVPAMILLRAIAWASKH